MGGEMGRRKRISTDQVELLSVYYWAVLCSASVSHAIDPRIIVFDSRALASSPLVCLPHRRRA